MSMSVSCVALVGVLGALTAALGTLSQPPDQGTPLQPPQLPLVDLPYIPESGGGGLLALLAGHGALGGHALARKSVRSPSRRLRFGRTDPDVPALPDADQWMWRSRRAPLRLRFGRRSAPASASASAELMAPLMFPDELQELEERSLRSPSMRLRFGRSGPPASASASASRPGGELQLQEAAGEDALD